MKVLLFLSGFLALPITPLLAIEEVEPNPESQPNNVTSASVITGSMPTYSFPIPDTDTFRIRMNHKVPVTVTATIRITSGTNPASVPVTLRLFSQDSSKQSISSGMGETSVIYSFHQLAFYPSDLFLQVSSLSFTQGERYEVSYSLKEIDKNGPGITFLRIIPSGRVRNFLGPNTRSVRFQVFDMNGVESIEVRAEGETYREIDFGTKWFPVKRTERTRFRFRQIRPIETVFVRAIDQLGNISVNSHRYKRIEPRSSPGSNSLGGRR